MSESYGAFHVERGKKNWQFYAPENHLIQPRTLTELWAHIRREILAIMAETMNDVMQDAEKRTHYAN